MKTLELIGPALDWAVAKCEGLPIRKDPMHLDGDYWIWPDMWPPTPEYARIGGKKNGYSPSTNWAQGGPIIERERIAINPSARIGTLQWAAIPEDHKAGSLINCWGSTPLTAAMRCYVVSKLGNEIEIPKELL